MPIEIYPPSRKVLSKSDSVFALQLDDWDDHSYRVMTANYRKAEQTKSAAKNQLSWLGD